MATIFKIKKLKPQFNQIVVTKELFAEQRTDSGIILSSKTATIKPYQKVLAVGPNVKGISQGDVVFINPKRYMTVEHKDGAVDEEKNIQKTNMEAQFNIPTFTVYDLPDGRSREVMLIGDNDVFFVADGEEFDTEPQVGPSDGILS